MKSNKVKLIAIILAILGVVLFSAKAVMVKLAYNYEVNAISLLLFRMAFAFPVYLAIAIIKRPKKSAQIQPKDYLWLIGFGMVGYYLASLFDFIGLQYIKASLERIILFTYPTLVILISWIFFKKRPTKVQICAILLSYLGIFIAFSHELTVSDSSNSKILLGGILILLSALTYAAYLVGSGYLIPKFGAVIFTSYAMMISCICVLIHFYLTGQPDLFNYPVEVYWLGFAMAILSTVVPSYLISFAIKHLGAADFSIIGSLGPISTIILAHIFLDETFTVIQLIGALIVIGGIILVSRGKA